MTTATEICNKALGWVGANRITDILVVEDTVEWILCDDNYDSVRDSVLEEREWSFAITRDNITPAVDVVAFGNETKFVIPTASLRVLSVHEPGSLSSGAYSRGIHDVSQIEDWEIEGQHILCVADEIDVRYIQQIADPAEYSASFVEAFATRLAAEFAPTLTESKSLTEMMWRGYEFKLAKAATLDGIQGRSRKIKATALTRRR